jgi:hypothetical protein
MNGEAVATNAQAVATNVEAVVTNLEAMEYHRLKMTGGTYNYAH